MKRSQLKELVKEIMGYSKYAPGGTTRGGTTDDFKTILTAIAKQRPEEEDSEEERARRGNALLDKANPENVAKILRGEKPMYEEKDEQTYLVHYRIGEDDDDDIEVKASSPEEAIQKLKSGEVKLAYGQSLPRLARSFSAKLINK